MDKGAKLRFVTTLTFARFPLVLVFFAGAVVYSDRAYREPWLFALLFTSLVASAATDLLDGYFARRLRVETALGAHADPLMDKFFYVSTMPLLVFISARQGHIEHATFLLVLTLFFLLRDQWVTFLRSIGSMYNISGKASFTGKIRTCLNFPLICCIYYFEESDRNLIPPNLLYAFEGIAFIINIVSVFSYTRFYWPYLVRSGTIK